MYKTYKFRLYPNNEQNKYIKAFDMCFEWSKTKLILDLSVRNWICENCGNENDRDINASINIMFEGLKLHYQN